MKAFYAVSLLLTLQAIAMAYASPQGTPASLDNTIKAKNPDPNPQPTECKLTTVSNYPDWCCVPDGKDLGTCKAPNTGGC
ncbi:hypothetical protein M378DRAFT_171562 [Amanita muscaria Koide BX008]|uniref:Uncharacterized protein n=1 Tax=Amanita muscaria (strain Koide BX008) TaxID=946122 RepID=A0A0C2SUA0_AMAMK|nr:hypothetical protein M378DRAFT_171562 [Amanita muscaria Koide BX008]